jgi:hypothetical protein
MVVLAYGHPDGRPHCSQFLACICTPCPHLRQHAPVSRAHVGTARAPPLLTRPVTCVTPDLLLKHPDATLTTYV